MVKRFFLKCNFGGQLANTQFFIGNPKSDRHPIAFQSKWLTDQKGGQVPQSAIESMATIQKIAEENNVSFEELFEYSVNIANKIPVNINKNFNELLTSLQDEK